MQRFGLVSTSLLLVFVGCARTALDELPAAPASNGGDHLDNGGSTGSGGQGGRTNGTGGGAVSTGDGITTGGAGVAGVGGGGNGGVPAPAEPNCGITTINIVQQPADLLLVLDRSGSMNDDIASDSPCGGGGAPANCTTRWSTMTTALNQVLTTSPASVDWGLKFFASPGGQTCTVTPGVDVVVGPNSAAQIQAAIAGTTPGSEAPTTAAINAAVAYLNTLDDNRSHSILLATDGQPNCDPGTSATVSTTSVTDTASAIAAAHKLGINTYVIGVGPSTANLDNFAQAAGASTYFPATSPDQLTAALTTIAAAVASCVFNLGKAPPDPTNVVVEFNADSSLRAPHDTTQTSGWDYISPTDTAIQLYGSYCDNFFNGTYKSVEILTGCPSPPRR